MSHSYYHGPCDRAGCLRVTKHKHAASDPLREGVVHREVLPPLRPWGDGTDKFVDGSPYYPYFSDTISVQELIHRLQQCPSDARISVEDGEHGGVVYAVHGEKVATLLTRYTPSAESFDRDHRILGVALPN